MISKHGMIWDDETIEEKLVSTRKFIEEKCAEKARPETTQNGNTIVRQLPCGVHPMHTVNVRANGSRLGCPMCEMAIEDLTRSMSPRAS